MTSLKIEQLQHISGFCLVLRRIIQYLRLIHNFKCTSTNKQSLFIIQASEIGHIGPKHAEVILFSERFNKRFVTLECCLVSNKQQLLFTAFQA